ncbi:MFS transporter [Thermotoga sp. Ku-13t]|uniref:MFS transporter n=1 Tax=Thermotoga sp. Ku-13t TaxID=1755813 RepID=UPI0013EDED6B|nr:MFS transporter [Thermotoga sp. Ku-13t]KAF2958792.1 MFS transporter [Thermotoga sp. Ku-13t]
MKFYLNLEGVASTLYILLTQGAIFTGLALAFGLDELLIGVTASFPMIAQVFQIFSPVVVEKIPKRRTLVNLFNLLSRLPWALLIVLLAFKDRNPLFFVFVFAVSQIFGALAGNAWTSLVRDLIPESERGRFFGRRNVYISFTSLVFFYVYSLLIDRLKDPLGYQLSIAIGMLGTLISFWSMFKVPEVPLKSSGARAEVSLVFQDKNFMRLCVFYFFWNVVIAFTSPFFTYHLLKNLQVPFSYIGLTGVLNSITAMIFYFFWGRLSDKVGHKSIAVAGVFIVSFIPPMWFFMNTFTYRYLMLADAVVSAIGWSAINLSFLTLPMEVAQSSSSAYFATYAALGGVGGLIGAVAGGATAKLLAGSQFGSDIFPIYGVQLMFLASGILRIFTLKLLTKVRARRYVPLRTLIASTLFLSRDNALTRSNGSNAYDILKVIRKKLEECEEDEKPWRVKRWW